MKRRTALLALALPLGLAAASAQAVDAPHNGALPVPANRIVGSWHTTGAVGPCGGPALGQINATVTFHAGGTMAMTGTGPTTGVPNLHGIPGLHTEGPGQGVWSFNPPTGRYRYQFRFNWFVNGVYHGYQDIVNDVTMDPDGLGLQGPVRASRYLANGQKWGDFCGEQVTERLY